MTQGSAADIPIYTMSEAARYAGTSAPSVARWRAGYAYPTSSGSRRSEAITSGSSKGLLSFNDLLEVAVVAAARRANVPMRAIRRAVDTAKSIYGVDKPLILLEFKHDGREVFTRESIDADDRIVNLSRAGQTAWSQIEDVLDDLDYEDGIALRWHPAGRTRPIVIDPRISFGRPYILGKGISTDVIRSRFAAGESIDDIADDLDVNEAEAEAAIRFELPVAA